MSETTSPQPPSPIPSPAPPPPRDSEPEPSRPALQDPSNGMLVDIEGFTSKETTFAGLLNQYFDRPSEARTFSADMASPLSHELEQELLELVILEEEQIDKLLLHLDDRRILILEGERRSGKATAAKYLATRV